MRKEIVLRNTIGAKLQTAPRVVVVHGVVLNRLVGSGPVGVRFPDDVVADEMLDGQVLGPIGVARLADETVIGGSLAIDPLIATWPPRRSPTYQSFWPIWIWSFTFVPSV